MSSEAGGDLSFCVDNQRVIGVKETMLYSDWWRPLPSSVDLTPLLAAATSCDAKSVRHRRFIACPMPSSHCRLIFFTWVLLLIPHADNNSTFHLLRCSDHLLVERLCRCGSPHSVTNRQASRYCNRLLRLQPPTLAKLPLSGR